MSKKIKSFTFTLPTYCLPSDPSKINFQDILRDYPGAIEYQYEEETVKYPNGAEILPLETRTEYFYASHVDGVLAVSSLHWYGNVGNKDSLKCRNVFLDHAKCRSSMNLERRHIEIAQEVYRINAKNNWEADWKDNEQKKYYCFWKHCKLEPCFDEKITYQTGGVIYYCGKAQEYLRNLSIEDLKAFLLIYS